MAKKSTQPTPGPNPDALVLSPEGVHELFKPARLEIFESLQRDGPASMAELAERIGRPADGLYYHVRKLLEIGVLRTEPAAEGTASRPGRPGAVYGLTAPAVTMALDPSSKASRDAWQSGANSVLRLAQRNVGQALQWEDVRTEGPDRNLLVWRTKGRLNRRDLRELNRHIDEITRLLQRADVGSGERYYAVTTVMTPVEKERG